jgi:hypothetical protein
MFGLECWLWDMVNTMVQTTKSEVRMRSRLMSVASHVKGLLRHTSTLIIVQLVAVRRAKN